MKKEKREKHTWYMVRYMQAPNRLYKVLEQKEIYAVLKNNLSLLGGLEFTPLSSARTKGDMYVPGTYTNFFFSFLPFDEIYLRLLFFTLGRCFYA